MQYACCLRHFNHEGGFSAADVVTGANPHQWQGGGFCGEITAHLRHDAVNGCLSKQGRFTTHVWPCKDPLSLPISVQDHRVGNIGLALRQAGFNHWMSAINHLPMAVSMHDWLHPVMASCLICKPDQHIHGSDLPGCLQNCGNMTLRSLNQALIKLLLQAGNVSIGS